MNKNIIAFWVLIISFFGILFWYTLVFAWNLWEIDFKLSNNIFSDSLNLNKNRVIIKSRENLSNLEITWDCSASWKLIEKSLNYYVFEIFLAEEKCDKKVVNVTFNNWDLLLNTSFNITTSDDLYDIYLDYSTEKLKKYLSSIKIWTDKLSSYEKYNKSIHIDKYDFLEKNRKLSELKYMESFISDIIAKRSQKYAVPIKWSKVTTEANKLPNTWRPYRAAYTDWVHEWWDFPAPFGETVLSLDYWVVVRIIDNFDYSNLDKIKYTWDLSDYDKAKNLDILRWKQVWVKTMKWDVAFYSHLNEIYSNIKVWDLVFKWQALWTVGITWVPDKNYTDYHLHIEVRQNPYNDTRKVWYSDEEYMNWDWYFKWKSEKYILENQNNIFE